MNYYTVMATYNQWMNQKLYAVCAEIPDVDRQSDRGAFFKSVYGTLNQMGYQSGVTDLHTMPSFEQVEI
ncbi:DinB family protein [Chamaesiphon sp.]|uniref:DinB family protein n=1 Tax=Chamaesiphon sp. TaxID=2814140 RepID=UPI0035934367